MADDGWESSCVGSVHGEAGSSVSRVSGFALCADVSVTRKEPGGSPRSPQAQSSIRIAGRLAEAQIALHEVSVHALVSTFLTIRWVVTTAVVVAMGVTSRMLLASIVLVYSSSMSIVSAVVLLVTPVVLLVTPVVLLVAPVVTTKVLLVMSIPSRLLSGLVNDSVAVSAPPPLDPVAGAIELLRELVLTGCGGYEREETEGGDDSLSASIELPIDPSGLSQFGAVLCPA